MSLPHLDRRRRASRRDPLAPTERTIRPQRGLPDGRAVVGGLLVGLAALGAWWLSVGARSSAPPSYVVARRAIVPGHHIELADLGLVPLELARSVRGQAFRRPDDVVGQVALGPIGPGGLVQADGLAASPGPATARELSFATDAQWAVDGTLRPGERIDVYATSDGPANPTELVVRGAVVRRIGDPGGSGLGAQPTQTVTIAVTEDRDLTNLVTAVRTGKLTIARATGALPDDAPAEAPRATTTSTSTTTTTTTTVPRRPRPTAPPATAPPTTAAWPFGTTPS